MAFLSANPTTLPNYVGEIQAEGDSSAVTGGGVNLPNPKGEGEGKGSDATEPKPQTETEPATSMVTQPATAPSLVRQPMPNPLGMPLPGQQREPEPAWQPSPVPVPEPVMSPVEDPFAPQGIRNGMKSPLQEPLAPSNVLGGANRPENATTPSLKVPNTETNGSTILNAINRPDAVKEAGSYPFKNAPKYNTEEVDYSILDGSAKSSQNLQNATAFLSSLFGGSGEGISQKSADKVVTGTKVLGAVEAVPTAVVTGLGAPAAVAPLAAKASEYGASALDKAYSTLGKSVNSSDFFNNLSFGTR